MNFNKRVNGSWTDIPHYIHNTSTDTITTLPAVLYPTGTTATVGLKGNMEQSGTPTPDNPIMPQGTGDKTVNLFDKDNYLQYNGYFRQLSGTTTISYESNDKIIYIPCKPNTTYTVSRIAGKRFAVGYTVDVPSDAVTVYDVNGSASGATSLTVTTTADAKYLVAYIRNGNISGEVSLTDIIDSLQIEENNTATTYQPYGYKTPISSASTTTPVYLGEVQTTRRVKKLVLTGEETIGEYDSTYNRFSIIISGSLIIGVRLSPVICSHYQAITDGRGIANVPNNAIYSDAISGNGRWFIKTTDYTSVADFKTFLQQQYAAGTPVTVWYVLATEETGIDNEPLRKIGDYADEVSDITIPVIAGGDTLSVGTTVQPSEVTVNYKGWHPVADVHEADNDEWT